MEKLDYKKQYKDLYLPPKKPVVVDVPEMVFLMVDGWGAPEEPSYQEAVSLLYSVAFTIKMSKRNGSQPEGYFDYVEPPLEGLWNCSEEGVHPDRSRWVWTSLLRQPEFVTGEVFRWAVAQAARKKPELDYARVRLEPYGEGLCVQMLHMGPYSREQETVDTLAAFLEREGLVYDHGRRHHEIYLSDPRRCAPERLKTVLRLPVKRKIV